MGVDDGTGGGDKTVMRLRVLLLIALGSGVGAEPATRPVRSSDPLPPARSIAALHVKAGYEAEIVAAEPLVMDPVAIDFGPDGKLWVVEMADYPMGMDGKGKPGGRVRYLEDTNGDGVYDKSTVFLDNLSFPNGVAAWRNGVLVTADGEIFYAEDTDGDGRADVRRPLFRGFSKTANPQLRVNSLRWGMDGWVYCAMARSGGEIESVLTGQKMKVEGRDLRVGPDDGALDPQSGVTQFGRDRNDYGDWFGCDNSRPLWHFVLDDDYTRRNPHVAAPDPRVQLMVPLNPKVYAVSGSQFQFDRTQASPGHPGHFTSACGASLYRDELLFPRNEIQHGFVCEPVHNLVHHVVLRDNGVTFAGSRAEDEQDREFLASEDLWFRPVFTRTGPDGALWVVDFYRYTVEHPQFLPPGGKEAMAALMREGDTLGRIYRVYPKGRRPAMPPRMDKFDTAALVAELESTNGIRRDAAQELLVWRKDVSAIPLLDKLFTSSRDPVARLQAMHTLNLFGGRMPEVLKRAMCDPHFAVRRDAVRLVEAYAKDAPELIDAAARLADDPDAKVRLQLACSLGQWSTPAAGEALARLGVTSRADTYLSAGVASSLLPHLRVVAGALAAADAPPAGPLYDAALATAVGSGDRESLSRLLSPVLVPKGSSYTFAHFETFARFLDDAAQHKQSLAKLAADSDVLSGAPVLFAAARQAIADGARPSADRIAAIALLGREGGRTGEDLHILTSLLSADTPPEVLSAAIKSLGRVESAQVPALLTAHWASYSPQTKDLVLEFFVAREPWAIQLLEQAKAGKISLHDLDATRRERFLKHRSAKVRQLAEKVLGASPNPVRQKVIDEYQPALSLKGDAKRGAKLFAQNCVTCHRKDDVGQEIGPNLGSVANWQKDALLVAILDPSRQFDPHYIPFTATLNDGETVYGIIASETSTSVTLRTLEAKDRLLPRTSLKSLQGHYRSLMPDGLEYALDKQAVADVIAFLQTSPAK